MSPTPQQPDPIFSTSGSYRTSFGTTGTYSQTGSFTTLRRVAVASNGDVWGADLWNWRLVRFARTNFRLLLRPDHRWHPP